MTRRRRKTRARYGTGSIYERPDRPASSRFVAVPPRQLDPKRRPVYAATRDEAERLLDERITELKAGLSSRPSSRLTTGQWLEKWVTEVLPEEPLKSRTRDDYARYVRLHIVPEIGAVSLRRLAPHDVRAMLRTMREKGLSDRSRQYAHAVLRRALNDAMREELITRNVATAVRAPRPETGPVEVLLEDELARILGAAMEHRIGALVVLSATTGLRLGELLGLRWADVNLADRVVTVTQTLRQVRTDGSTPKRWTVELGEPKSKAGTRALPLLEPAADALKRHRERQVEERSLVGAEWSDNGLVFTDPFGGALTHRHVQRKWYLLLDEAGVERRGFHVLRRTFSTSLALEGVHPKVAQQMLGHSRAELTMSVYTAALPEMVRDAGERVARRFQT